MSTTLYTGWCKQHNVHRSSHHRAFTHCRDIKSTNVLVDNSWRAKLCDFSFACHNESTSKRDYVYGTEEFMAPEISLALDFNMTADIFSFGIILCELITGLEPSGDFLCRRPQELFALNEEELNASVHPDCPHVLHALALQCCDLEPSKRPSAQDCASELSVSGR